MRELLLKNGVVVKVSDVDFDAVQRYHWRARTVYGKNSNHTYAVSHRKIGKGRWVDVAMHRLIMNAPEGSLVDHINGDGLDNRRENLRLATQSENLRNRRKYKGSSKYLGVGWNKWRGVWVATVGYENRVLNLGTFKTEEEAARFRDDVASKLHGEFASLNFPRST